MSGELILPPFTEASAHWEFDDATGLMRRRDAGINDCRISAAERRVAVARAE